MENMEKVVYLDNAATTPCAPEALEMMVKALSGACGFWSKISWRSSPYCFL